MKFRHFISNISSVAHLPANIALIGLFVFLALHADRTYATEPTLNTNNQDIVLCLDSSDRFRDTNVEIVRIFMNRINNFSGERISIVLWNSSTMVALPLSDNYTVAKQTLDLIGRGLSGEVFTKEGEKLIWENTLKSSTIGSGASRIDLGIISCIGSIEDGIGSTNEPEAETTTGTQTQIKPKTETDRQRIIILVTDNTPEGSDITPISNLSFAIQDRDIVVYAMNPNESSTPIEATGSLKRFADSSGGKYFNNSKTSDFRGIIEEIDRLESEHQSETPEPETPSQNNLSLLIVVGSMIVGFFLLIIYRTSK